MLARLRGGIAVGCIAVLITGCSNDTSTGQPDPQQKSVLRALSVPATGGTERIIFVGYQADLQQQLSDVLAGSTSKEPWYLIRLPANLMPAADTKADFELQTQPGITITHRMPFNFRDNITDWGTLDFTSAQTGLDGFLKITGPQLVDSVKTALGQESDGTKWGVELHVDYRGSYKVNEYQLDNGHLEITMGALMDVE